MSGWKSEAMPNPERTRLDERKNPACPICRKPAAPDHAPFCSERCRQIDLNRWLSEAYRVETDEASDGIESDKDR